MASKSASSASPIKSSFSIFQDETAQLPIAIPGHANNENFEPSETLRSNHLPKSTNRPSCKNDPASRMPLTDVTLNRTRSLSSALAEIARLGDELDASKGENQALRQKNRDLKGEIVAYQDALNQADEDAGYL